MLHRTKEKAIKRLARKQRQTVLELKEKKDIDANRWDQSVLSGPKKLKTHTFRVKKIASCKVKTQKGTKKFRDKKQGFSWDEHAVDFRLTELPIFPGYWAAGGGK